MGLHSTWALMKEALEKLKGHRGELDLMDLFDAQPRRVDESGRVFFYDG